MQLLTFLQSTCQTICQCGKHLNTEIMVLLPKPPIPKESNDEIKRNVFFENDAMDHLAKHFVGNNYR